MTQRELMNAIINHEPITEEMVETAKGIIEHMNKANESKKSKISEKRATEIAPIIEKINTFLNGILPVYSSPLNIMRTTHSWMISCAVTSTSVG